MKHPAVLVAKAVVAPQTDNVVMRLLNPRPEPVRIYRGSGIASLELVDEPVLLTASVDTATTPTVSTEKQEMLWGLAE